MVSNSTCTINKTVKIRKYELSVENRACYWRSVKQTVENNAEEKLN
jgi:hypothetical protein